MRINIIRFFLLIFLNFNLLGWDFKIDTDNDGKIDRWVKADVMKNWDLLDVNKNRTADEKCFYISNKNIVYIIHREEMDSNSDGKPDIFIDVKVVDKDFFREISFDSNYDGKIDTIYYERMILDIW